MSLLWFFPIAMQLSTSERVPMGVNWNWQLNSEVIQQLCIPSCWEAFETVLPLSTKNVEFHRNFVQFHWMHKCHLHQLSKPSSHLTILSHKSIWIDCIMGKSWFHFFAKKNQKQHAKCFMWGSSESSQLSLLFEKWVCNTGSAKCMDQWMCDFHFAPQNRHEFVSLFGTFHVPTMQCPIPVLSWSFEVLSCISQHLGLCPTRHWMPNFECLQCTQSHSNSKHFHWLARTATDLHFSSQFEQNMLKGFLERVFDHNKVKKRNTKHQASQHLWKAWSQSWQFEPTQKWLAKRRPFLRYLL